MKFSIPMTKRKKKKEKKNDSLPYVLALYHDFQKVNQHTVGTKILTIREVTFLVRWPLRQVPLRK